jgi:cupin fold WbuC family metalloprotein
MSVTVFSTAYLDGLVDQATASPRLRQHRNIHTNYDDPCQRLFNAIEPGSYIRPHRHRIVPRTETMIAVRGLMKLLMFDDAGNIVDSILFSAESCAKSQDISVGVEIPPDVWHTVIALHPHSVLLEIKAGPFDPAQPKELAPWAPEEGSAEASQYLHTLITATHA